MALGRGVEIPPGGRELEMLSERLVKDLCFLKDTSSPQLTVPPNPAFTTSASQQACRQRIKRGFQQASFELGFHVDEKKTYTSLFYTTESLREDFLKELLQVLRVVEIIQGFLVAKIFPPIC